ncbi:MAG: serpin family protein [Anaerolineae bacterium]|nr:serpin family protein [Anaerolineae bacterium]
MHDIKRWLSLIVILAAACSALGSSISAPVARADVERQADPPTDDIPALVAGNNTFAFDLYHQIVSEQDGNLIFSPYSISTALAMVYAGARSDTAAQMAQTLHYTLPPERLHPAFNALDRILQPPEDQRPTPVPEGGYTNPADDLTLHIANSLWGQEGFPFEDNFLRTLALNYGAGINLADFSKDPNGAQKTMNQWIEQMTNGHIKDMPPPGSITPATRLALINAIYFKAEWAFPFNPKETHDAPFHLQDGGDITVPMMVNNEAEIKCLRGEDYNALQMTYGADRKAAMLLLLPDADKFRDFESRLDASMFQKVLSEILFGNILDFRMPRFKFDSEVDLRQKLSTMGMAEAFGSEADFSGISSGDELFLDSAQHKATISIDEQGTEASGATLVVMAISAQRAQCDNPLIADRPFIFAIYHQETGAILFLGRVLNPAA